MRLGDGIKCWLVYIFNIDNDADINETSVLIYCLGDLELTSYPPWSMYIRAWCPLGGTIKARYET